MNNSKLKSPFSDHFLESIKTDPIANKVFNMLLSGSTPYEVIENLCKWAKDTNESYANLIKNGPQPQIIVTTQEHYDKLVAERQITNG